MKVNIKKLRLELDRLSWSIPTLAIETGLPRQTIYLIFQNETAQLRTLTKIAETLALDPKDLLVS